LNFFSKTKMEIITGILAKHYHLGKVIWVKEISGGYTNQSYTIGSDKNGITLKYLLRKYHPNTTEKEIIFEHALIRHLRQHGFKLAASMISTTTGSTYVKNPESIGGKSIIYFWALFEFLEGEDRYTWMDTHISQPEIFAASQVLAKLHHSGRQFKKPPGADRAQLRIMEFLPTFPAIHQSYVEKSANTKCRHLLLKHVTSINRIISKNIIPKSHVAQMPHLTIHCDYHQGNLKFQGESVVGVFDFDWSKVDIRLFDVALALIYFTAGWKGENAGKLIINKSECFLRGYHEVWKKEPLPGPLTSLEKKYFPQALAAANFFVLHWAIVDYFTTPNANEDEYKMYMEHQIDLMYWIEAHPKLIAMMLQVQGIRG